MSLLGTLGGIAGGIVGFATGGPGGAIAGYQGGTKLFGGGTVTTLPSLPGGPSPFAGGNTGPSWLGPGSTIAKFLDPQGNISAGGGCPKGYHLNKKPLAAGKHHGAVAAGAMCVRNRHINPLNARAITRSLRRVKRARKLVAKLHSFNPVRSSRSGGHRPGCGCFRCRKR